MKFVLVREKTNRPVKVGATLTTGRGEKVVLKGWSEPYDAALLKERYTGDINDLNPYRGARIYVVPADEADDWQGHQSQYFPSVCDLKFVVVP